MCSICKVEECSNKLSNNNTSGYCKRHRKEYERVYHSLNKEKIQEKHYKHYILNKERIDTYNRQWYENNKSRMQNYHAQYCNNKYKNDINFKICTILRSRLNKAVKRNQKSGSAVRDLGCTIDFLKTYLESMFLSGMSWSNHGEWEIDHILPLSSFDRSNPEELKKACHYTNLQPLWAKDNLSKSNKIQPLS
jgi:hypothetical protein